jgi:F420-dependent oxidoreductase-like protein
MIDVAIMIEGQNGLNWDRWKGIGRAVEKLGYAGLFRSDHFTNMRPPDIDSLELWVSLVWLAENTERIEFGPLVTPCSFRHPVFTARFAKDVDDLSGGRLRLGLGAGWQEREHEKFGFDLLETGERLDRFEEGVEVVRRLLQAEGPVDYDGRYYRLKQAELLPRPQRADGPPLVIGGNGKRRTLPLAAARADEWNGIFLTPDQYAEYSQELDRLLDLEGRDPSDLRRSIMTNVIFGADRSELEKQVQAAGQSEEELREQGRVVGTAPQIREQIQAYERAGADAIMLQWLDLEDLEGLEALARGIL